ncbi:hypothetical protein Q5752_005960 [Cryptotrichosporon argae]
MYRSARLFRPLAVPAAALRQPRPLALAHVRARAFADRSTDKPKDKPSGPANVDGRVHADYQNATSSAREEVKGISRGFAELISGGSPQAAAAGAREQSMQVSHKGNINEDFASITRDMITSVPKPALYFGAAGTLPYLGTATSIVFLAREAARASQGASTITGMSLEEALAALHTLEHVQITYGAIILSFLGAIHWGMEFAKLGGTQGYTRLALGVVPALFAWPTTFLDHGVALAAQWCGFTGMWFIDQRASANGWTTSWYSTYRFYLSLIVGFSIIGTFAGTSYYGAGAGAVDHVPAAHHQHTTDRVSAMKRLDRVRERNFPAEPSAKVGRQEGTVGGDMQVDENEDGDSFLVLRNVEKEEARKREEEEEKRKKAAAQDKKEEHQQDKAPGAMKSDAKNRTGNNENENQGGKQEGTEGKPGANKMGMDEDQAASEKKGKEGGKEDGKEVKEDGKDKAGKASNDGKPDDGKSAKGSTNSQSAAADSTDGGGDGDEAGKSQSKKDDPDAKGAAGAKNTGKK